MEDRWWDRNCRRCGQPFAGPCAASPIGWMHPECARLPLEPRWPLTATVLERLSHRVLTLHFGPCVWFDGDLEVDIVGESHRFENFVRLAGPPQPDGHHAACIAMLLPELTNPHDPEALAVRIQDLLVGYLPREDRTWVRAVLHAVARYGLPVACAATVSGGFILRDGTPADFCVRLLLPDLLGMNDQILALPHSVTTDEAGAPIVLLHGAEEVDIAGESDFQEHLEAVAGPRCPEGHRIEALARFSFGGRDLDVIVSGKKVGELRRSPKLWNRISTVLSRRTGHAMACKAVITGGKGGKGVRRTQYQVKLLLPRLPMSLMDE